MAPSSEGTQAAYDSTSERVSNMRSTGTTGGYDEDDWQRQEDTLD